MSKKSITSNLTEAIQGQIKSFEGDKKIQEFERASEQFDKFVKDGMVEKRGYTLMTPDQAHLHIISFNKRG